MTNKKWVKDAIDAKNYLISEGVFLFELDQPLQELIIADYPKLGPSDFISQEHLADYRLRYLNGMMTSDKLKNDSIRDMVYDVSKKQKIIF